MTSGADREARQIARRLRRANPDATLIATGCYAERDRSDLASLVGVDHVVGMQDQADRIGELAAGIAHEIKNPLAGMLGALEILGMGLPLVPSLPMLDGLPGMSVRRAGSYFGPHWDAQVTARSTAAASTARRAARRSS